MVREALTGYWSLVSGLTEVTVERARTAARQLVSQGEATRDQVTALTKEITETSRANREALVHLVRYEAERAAGKLGFASTDELTVLQGRVRDLERDIAALRTATDRLRPASPPSKTITAKATSTPPAKAPKSPPAKAAPEPGAAEPAAPTKVPPAKAPKATPAKTTKAAPAEAVPAAAPAAETTPAKATKAAKAAAKIAAAPDAPAPAKTPAKRAPAKKATKSPGITP